MASRPSRSEPGVLDEGQGWREVPAPRHRQRPGRALREASVLPDLDAVVWGEAVAEAERLFGAGIQVDAPEGWRWETATAHRRVMLVGTWVAGGARLDVEHHHAPPRPWQTALTLVCAAAAAACAVVLVSRPSEAAEWAVVGGLCVLPVAAAASTAARTWRRSRSIRRRFRRVLVAAERAAWREVARPVEPEEVEVEAFPMPRAASIAAPEWLSADEAIGLADARPARVEPSDLRHARRIVERPVSEERPAASPAAALPEGFAEWHPPRADS